MFYICSMNLFITTELIGKSSRLITNNLARELLNLKLGITTEQWIILQILSKGSTTQKRLSEITLKNKASINSLVNNLLKKGLINKSISNVDKRETVISITKSGSDIREKVKGNATKSINTALNGFSAIEIETLNTFLERVNNNLIKEI